MVTAYKLVVYVPVTYADQVRTALGEAGAGRIGNYQYCSFSVRGIGRFLPVEGAKPMIGVVGQFEQVEEERIEVTCDATLLEEIVHAMKAVHPYEEVAYDLYPLTILP